MSARTLVVGSIVLASTWIAVCGSCSGEADADAGIDACENPVPLVIQDGALDILGAPTGFDLCEAGNFWRREPATCPAPVEDEPECGAGFFCGDTDPCRCEAVCTSDDECQPTELCLCTPHGGECVPTTCRTAADCAGGEACTSTQIGCGRPRFSCTTQDDECKNDRECDTGEPDYCVFDDSTRRRVCKGWDGDCD